MLALGQVEVERRRGRRGPSFSGAIGGPERARARVSSSGSVVVVGAAVDGGLRLLVGELGGRAHQDAVEAVAALAPVGAEHHPHRERRRGPRLRAASRGRWRCARAASARRGRGSRRELPRSPRLAVERRAGADVGGDVGDGDPDDAAAGIAGSSSGSAWTASSWSLASGGSMVTQRQRAPVLAMRPSSPARGRLGLGERGLRRRRAGCRGRRWRCRLIARSVSTGPSRSTTRAAGAPKRPSRSSSSATQLAVAARRRRGRAGTKILAPRARASRSA